MIDPLTAIGLASSLVQLIDFSAKVVKKAKEIHEHGSNLEELRMIAQARDADRMTEDLRTREKLLKSLPNNNSNGRSEIDAILKGSSHFGFDILRARREEKFKRARQDLNAIDQRIQGRKEQREKLLVEQGRGEKILMDSTNEFLLLREDLQSRAVTESLTRERLAHGENVSR